MDERQWLAQRFEEQRTRLTAVAYRMLGSTGEAEDAVQEAWLRLQRSGVDGVENMAGWMTTIVARVALNMLQSRKTRREEPMVEHDPVASPQHAPDPEAEALQADSIGLALLVVLDTLSPAERIAFVLHDLFAVPFDEIATILERTPAAARQLASRARKRVHGARHPDGEVERKRDIIDAFLAASRGGDFAALLELLDPDVMLRVDAAVVRMGGDGDVHGADAVAKTFAGRAKAARLALIDGWPGAVWGMGGAPKVVFAFTIAEGRIVGIEMIADSARLADFELEILS